MRETYLPLGVAYSQKRQKATEWGSRGYALKHKPPRRPFRTVRASSSSFGDLIRAL